MRKSETTSLCAYHIIKKKNEYCVYNPELILKGRYSSYDVAFKNIKDMNTQRHIIIVHDTNGIIREIIRPHKENCFSLTEIGKATPMTTRKKTIVLNERKKRTA